MVEKVKISVIIPVYNTEKYLNNCLDSLLNQSFKDFEIICIDDSSIDNSLKLLKNYKENFNNFTIIKTKHKGAAHARNKGLAHAKGKYVIFLDSDDYFEFDLLEKLYSKAQNHNCDIVICSSKKVDEQNNLTETDNPNFPLNLSIIPFEKVFNKNDFINDIFNLSTPVPWNKLFLKEFLLKNKIKFPPLKIYEDIAFCHCAFAVAQKIYAVNDKLVNYRFKRKGSLADTRGKNTIKAVESCFILKDFLVKKGLYEKLKNAYNKALLNHIRSEISYCRNDELNNFIISLKKYYPKEKNLIGFVENFKKITPEFLNNLIKDKKTLLYGASLFIEPILKDFCNKNITGIIDNNKAKEGETFCNYKIYSKEILFKTKAQQVILTILSNNEEIFCTLEKEFQKNYPRIKLINLFKEEPKITIITPCYNGKEHLKPYIKGLLAQTYGNIEYIFVNDGSNDSTEEIILSYKKDFISKGWDFKYIKQKNKGQAAAINRGLKTMEGEYFCCIDSDDIIEPDFIFEMSDFLKQNPDKSICFPIVELVEEKTLKHIKFSKRIVKNNNDTYFDEMLEANRPNIPPFPCYMIRTGDFLKIYPERKIYQGKSGQNIQLIAPFAHKQKIGYVDKKLFKYVVRKNSDCHKICNKKFINWQNNYLSVIKKCNMTKEEERFYTKKIKKIWKKAKKEESNMIKDENYLKKLDFKKTLKQLSKRLKNKTAVIYGAGIFFEEINKNYDLKPLNIRGICDMKFKDSKEETFLGYKILSIDEIKKLKPDYVLVGTKYYTNLIDELNQGAFKNTGIKIRALVQKPLIFHIKEILNNG